MFVGECCQPLHERATNQDATRPGSTELWFKSLSVSEPALGAAEGRLRCISRVSLPRPRDQFFELHPARKSRTSSPGLNTTAGAIFPDSAILRLTSVKSAFTQPTLETSMSPSRPIQIAVGTLVRP